MPELADPTVKALIIALLDMPLDAVVEIQQPDIHKTRSIINVSEQPGTGYGMEFVTLELDGA